MEAEHVMAWGGGSAAGSTIALRSRGFARKGFKGETRVTMLAKPSSSAAVYLQTQDMNGMSSTLTFAER